MTIDETFNEILSKCKFISKKDEWFDEGTESTLMSVVYGYKYVKDQFKDGVGGFSGMHEGNHDGCEYCPLDEFLIYDEFGREISESTLEEYKYFLNK